MALLFAILGAVVIGGSFFLGLAVATKIEIRKALREAGLGKETARLYGRAAKLLKRLDQTTDFDGAYAGDVLSEETKTLVAEWVADYRKQISKV